MELAILIGIPATGKTTFSTSVLARTHVRICRDVVKTKHREWSLFQTCLETGTPVVLDNTNVTRAERARFIQPAHAAKFRVVGYFFRSRRDEAIVRNRERPPEARVPDVAIGGKSSELELPSEAEGFDQLYFVRTDSGGFAVEEWVA